VPEASVKIKWPNDLLLNQRKIAGILIEHSVMNTKLGWCIAGIGLNVNQERFDETLPQATSIHAWLGHAIERNNLLKNIIHQIHYQFSVLQNDAGSSLNQLYLERLFQLNQTAMYRQNGELFEATITKIDEYGRLVLKKNGRDEVYCDVKEIEFVY
jgi:BirA family biotin operon repressor/biotin-[acetyl-CoA-carboxylase] ligase